METRGTQSDCGSLPDPAIQMSPCELLEWTWGVSVQHSLTYSFCPVRGVSGSLGQSEALSAQHHRED